jgi:hypothetical protein
MSSQNPNEGLNPADFPLGSPESRAAARIMANDNRNLMEIEILTEGIKTPRQSFTIELWK